MTIIIKACLPTINPLFYRSNRISFTISSSSLKLPQSGLTFPVSGLHRAAGPPRPTSSLLLINNPNARSLSFQCRNTRTKAGSDSGLWRQYAPKMQTSLIIWMFFVWFVWMLFSRRIKDVFSTVSKLFPKWVMVVSSLILVMVKLLPKSKQKKPMNVSFDDLVCVDHAKHELQAILRILKREGGYKQFKLPDGVLLYGPPGTGKSTLVHALACEAKVPFFHVSATDLASDRIQDSMEEIEKIFIEARICSPSIVFIEDLHAFATWGKNGESHPAFKKLYTEMNKCDRDGSRVAVIAETNRREKLRSVIGTHSFYTRLYVGKLNKDAKRKIIGLHLKEFLREEDKEVICKLVALRTPDLNWDDLENIADRCIRIAVCRGDDHVTKQDVFEALRFTRRL